MAMSGKVGQQNYKMSVNQFQEYYTETKPQVNDPQ